MYKFRESLRAMLLKFSVTEWLKISIPEYAIEEFPEAAKAAKIKETKLYKAMK